jgi:ABC-type polysaccharide/polyol phosphate transport system ATPase subunit
MAAIEVTGAGKRYSKLDDRAMLIKSIMPFWGATKSEYWALRDLTFSLEAGATLGIIGRNGAGKTTLLRLLAGVTRPSEGRVRVRGRVAPLISVNVGFHQEMSGRENVYVNGILLGLTKREVAARFDEIAAFAELDDFIDTPVKFYSSGMLMRLGFSIVAHVEAEMLLVDEILAVGDTAFQLKCFDRMRALQSNGATIVMVSHSMHAIRLLCPRTMLINKGHLEFDGPTEDAIARHHELMTTEPADGEAGAVVAILSRELLGADGFPTHHPAQDERVRYRVTVRFDRETDSPQMYARVMSEAGILVYEITSVLDRDGRVYQSGDTATYEMSFIPRLGAGTYRIMLAVTDRHGREPFAYDAGGFVFYISPHPGVGGVVDLSASLTIDGVDASDWGELMMSGGVSGAVVDPSVEL